MSETNTGRWQDRGSVKRVALGLTAMALAVSITGCPLLKKKAVVDDDDDPPPPSTADAATVSVSDTGAKNEAAILRYATETPLSNEPAVIGRDGTVARTFPPHGPQVAILSKGTPVAKIAAYFSTGVLVMFDDSSGDGSKLLGWVSPKAFDAAAPAPTKIIVPPKKDAGAPAPPPPPQDAGSPPPPPPPPPPVVDAGGGGGGQASTKRLAVQPDNGKCPDGYTVAEGMCRIKCKEDKECPRNTKCGSKGGSRVCTSDL